MNFLDLRDPAVQEFLWRYTEPSDIRHDYTRIDAITHVTKAAVTAWPIVFAAILGQTLKAVATYRVERGIRLGVATNFSLSCNKLTD